MRQSRTVPRTKPGIPQHLGLYPTVAACFLNWMRTNNALLTTWAQRTTLASARQDGPMGVAPELTANLCNQPHADAWNSIPYH